MKLLLVFPSRVQHIPGPVSVMATCPKQSWSLMVCLKSALSDNMTERTAGACSYSQWSIRTDPQRQQLAQRQPVLYLSRLTSCSLCMPTQRNQHYTKQSLQLSWMLICNSDTVLNRGASLSTVFKTQSHWQHYQRLTNTKYSIARQLLLKTIQNTTRIVEHTMFGCNRWQEARHAKEGSVRGTEGRGMENGASSTWDLGSVIITARPHFGAFWAEKSPFGDKSVLD